MIITLGISAYFHDSAAALLIDGEIICAAQEERFNRIKNSADFPSQAIAFCLKQAKIDLSDVDEVVFYEKPLLKFERLLETYYTHVPKGWQSFLKAIPEWSQKKLFLKREIKRELKALFPGEKSNYKLYFSSHHLSHAASAYYPSPYDESAILCIDAVGEWSTASISKGKGNEIEISKEMKFPDSLGLLYSSFTYYLGFKVNEGEYKMMGLSPFGNPVDEQTQKFIDIIRTQLVKIHADGSIQLNQKYFKYTYGLRMVQDKQWEKLFGFSKRLPADEVNQTHANFSYAIQKVTEEVVLKMAQTAKEITGSKNLCLAGGVALNCVANGLLHSSQLFKNIWIQPAAGDAGGALGAALALYYVKHPSIRNHAEKDHMQNGFLGPEITRNEIEEYAFTNEKAYRKCTSEKERNEFVASELSKGKVIGWMQGKMEFGPRALGGRSILALPSIPDMQSKLNLAVKFREDFRPFAPVMLGEEAQKYFSFEETSPYMQFVQKLSKEYRFDLPENFESLSIKEKLNVPRSKFQAITHVDFSARLQVISDPAHPLFNLLLKVREKTDDAILINTSFNRNGEPIVCGIKDAFDCFEETKIDILVLENYIFTKE